MPDEGVLGNGVRVGFSLTSPVDWKEIGQLLEVVSPGLEPDKVEKTTHGATYHRFMRGLLNVSDLELKVLVQGDPADPEGVIQDQLYDLQMAGTTIWWRVESPVDRARTKYRAVEYEGVVMNAKPDTPIADKQVLSLSVSFDGDSFTRYPEAAASAF